MVKAQHETSRGSLGWKLGALLGASARRWRSCGRRARLASPTPTLIFHVRAFANVVESHEASILAPRPGAERILLDFDSP